MVMPGTPTRFPNGVTNAAQNGDMASLRQLDPTLFHTFWDDFDGFVIQDGSTSPIVQWTITLNSGTIDQTAVNGGNVLFTLANTDEAITQMQRTAAAWLPAVGKRTWFKSRFKLSSASLVDCFVGLSVIDTTIIAASAIDVTDAIGFFKAATASTWTLYCRKDATTGSTSQASIGGITADTYLTLSWYYDGGSKLYYGYNGVWYGALTVSSSFLPDAQLSPSICIGQEGTGGANTGTFDYIFVAQER